MAEAAERINLNLRINLLQRAGSQILEQEAVKLKLNWGPQDYNDAKANGCLARIVANRKWSQPRRKNFVAVNKDAKGFEDMKTALPSDMEIQSLGFAQVLSCLALGIEAK